MRLGIGLTMLAVLGFVLYPWYLLWGWPLLVVSGRRRLVVISSLLAAAFTLANLWPQRREVDALWRGSAEDRVLVTVGCLLVVIALAVIGLQLRRSWPGSEQVATADGVPTGIGGVQAHPTIGIEDPRPFVSDWRTQRKGRAPADSQEDVAAMSDVHDEPLRIGTGDGTTIRQRPSVIDLIE